MTRVAYLPGDGIGPEVCDVARRVLDAAGFRAEWVELPVGWREWCERGEPLPRQTLAGLRSMHAGLFGAVTSKTEAEAERELDPAFRGQGLRYRSPIVRLRQELDLFANVRPIVSYAGNPHNIHDDVDLVVFRENTEGLYAGIEALPFPAPLRQAWLDAAPDAPVPEAGPGTAVSLRVVTRRAAQRISRAAFEYARLNGRHRVTLVEKANVLRATGGLATEAFEAVAAAYPDIPHDTVNLDAACARLVRRPREFEVLVATNLFGDVLSDLAAELAGGLPLAASVNLGDRFVLFEPVHGSAPGIAGRGVANPLGAVLTGAMLARHVGQGEAAATVEAAVRSLISDGTTLPHDLGGSARTDEVEAALLARVGLPARVRAD